MGYLVSLLLGGAAWARGVLVRKPGGGLVAGLLWLWMWLLSWANTANPDSQIYRRLYSGESAPEGIADGYLFLVERARDAGFSYEVFVAMLAGSAFILIAATAAQFTSNPALTALLYFAYPFIYDAIQLRNLMMMALLTFGFALMHRYRRLGPLLFVGIVAVASTIHWLALASLILLVVRARQSLVVAKTVAALGLGLTVVTMVDPSIVSSILGGILARFATARLDAYTETVTRWGVLAFGGLQLATIVMLRHAWLVVSASTDEDIVIDEPSGSVDVIDELSRSVDFVRSSYVASLMMTVLLPAVAINSNFWRPIRNIWILCAIAFAVAIQIQRRRTGRSTLLWGVLALTLAQCGFHVLIQFDWIVRPLLENNWILDSLGSAMSIETP